MYVSSDNYSRNTATVATVEDGFAALKTWLASPRDRAATQGASWPFTVAPIQDRSEFTRPLPASLPEQKRCGSILDESALLTYADENPFAAITRQFRAIADQLCAYVEEPRFPTDLFWQRSTVEPGKRQFIGWHTDGEVTIKRDGEPRVYSANETLGLLATSENFTPNHLYLQATLELPTAFASNVTREFSANIVEAVRQGRAYANKLNEPKLQGWVDQNAIIRTAAPGNIIAFPSGVLHTGVAADRMCTRTIVVGRLNLKNAL